MVEDWIEYDMPLWRPPSEARSLIIQATLGCSHNRCTFCRMYKTKRFRVRQESEVFADLDRAAKVMGSSVRRIFLADGDAMVLPTDRMCALLERCHDRFEHLDRVTCYATPENLLRKADDDLVRIRRAGLTMVYYGVESGDDPVLEEVHKGATADEIAQGAAKAHHAGLVLSATVLLGLAGRDASLRHAANTGRLLSRMQPEYAAALTITEPDEAEWRMLGVAPPRLDVGNEKWHEMSPWDLVAELRALVANMDMTDCVFRSNHASNYLALSGHLPIDKTSLLDALDRILRERDARFLRPESWRRL